MFNDTREFIEALRSSGDLVEIKDEIHWDLELGAISRLACEKDGPAIWFKRITDYPKEMTVFANPMATWRRVAIDRKSTRLNSSHIQKSRMPSSA